MQIHISPNDGVPIYLQIINQIKYLVGAKRLAAGDEMPTIRALAEQLIVNPSTVARAYRELEREGLLTSRQGSGTHVSAAGSPLSDFEKVRILTERTDALLTEADQLNVSYDDLIELIEERYVTMKPHMKEFQK